MLKSTTKRNDSPSYQGNQESSFANLANRWYCGYENSALRTFLRDRDITRSVKQATNILTGTVA